jgi:hypothetical protein
VAVLVEFFIEKLFMQQSHLKTGILKNTSTSFEQPLPFFEAGFLRRFKSYAFADACTVTLPVREYGQEAPAATSLFLKLPATLYLCAAEH